MNYKRAMAWGVLIVTTTLARGEVSQSSPDALIGIAGVALSSPRPDMLLANIVLKNTSGQIITGYTVSVSLEYSDGKVLSRSVTTDSAWTLCFGRLGVADTRGERFDAGTVRHESIGFPPDPLPGAKPTVRAAEVKMAALGDRSIYGASSEVEHLRGIRLADALRTGEILGALVALQNASDPSAELTRMTEQRRSASTSDPAARRSAGASADLLEKMLRPIVASRRDAAALQQYYQARRDVLIEHSNLIEKSGREVGR